MVLLSQTSWSHYAAGPEPAARGQPPAADSVGTLRAARAPTVLGAAAYLAASSGIESHTCDPEAPPPRLLRRGAGGRGVCGVGGKKSLIDSPPTYFDCPLLPPIGWPGCRSFDAPSPLGQRVLPFWLTSRLRSGLTMGIESQTGSGLVPWNSAPL